MTPQGMVDSASDDRTANNVMRHQYRVLSDEEKLQMTQIKDLGADFVSLCQRIPGWPNRELELATQRMEEAVFWAVKFITGEKS